MTGPEKPGQPSYFEWSITISPLTRAFSDAHPELLSAEETIEVPSVVAVGGELSTRLGRLPAVRLGTFEISMPLTQFSQNTSGILATPDLAGIIGAQMLRRFTVIFDYTHREMILEPNEHFSEPSVSARNGASP